MKIVVLVKEVPDTYGDRKLTLETGLADRAASEAVIDEIGERALEVALSYADEHEGTEITVLTMAPEGATSTIRKALAMGATNATHVCDEALAGADLLLTAEVLAAALRQLTFDVVITGNVSTDGAGGMIPAMLAENLGVPHLTGLRSVELSDSQLRGVRPVENGTEQVSASLPAVLSITEALPGARFPNFKGIMAAKKKPVATLTLSDLGIDPHDATRPSSIMITAAERPARAAGVKIIDEGDAGRQLADFLLQNRLV